MPNDVKPDVTEEMVTAATPSPEVARTRKVTVNFAAETYQMLDNVAKSRNVSMTEALRQAIGLLAFYVDTTAARDRILIERNGQTSELRIL